MKGEIESDYKTKIKVKENKNKGEFWERESGGENGPAGFEEEINFDWWILDMEPSE